MLQREHSPIEHLNGRACLLGREMNKMKEEEEFYCYLDSSAGGHHHIIIAGKSLGAGYLSSCVYHPGF